MYPEDFPSNNRITEQLMYINPKLSEEGLAQPLKKVLMWNGMISWSGVDIGQKEFLKQDCPVNRDIIGFTEIKNNADYLFFSLYLFNFERNL